MKIKNPFADNLDLIDNAGSIYVLNNIKKEMEIFNIVLRIMNNKDEKLQQRDFLNQIYFRYVNMTQKREDPQLILDKLYFLLSKYNRYVANENIALDYILFENDNQLNNFIDFKSIVTSIIQEYYIDTSIDFETGYYK